MASKASSVHVDVLVLVLVLVTQSLHGARSSAHLAQHRHDANEQGLSFRAPPFLDRTESAAYVEDGAALHR